MPNSTKLGLPLLTASQSQKHVTHNEAINKLDILVQLNVLDRDLTAPPGSPVDGACYIVGSGATGAWATKDLNVAAYQSGVWKFFAPYEGWIAWIVDENTLAIWTGAAWATLPTALSLITKASQSEVAIASHGAAMQHCVVEELVTCTGAAVSTSIQFPNRAIVLGASVRVVAAVTGATSYSCGISGEDTKFGSSLGVAAGSNNMGVIGPTAVYTDTPVLITAAGGNFTGGTIRVALHYILNNPSTS